MKTFNFLSRFFIPVLLTFSVTEYSSIRANTAEVSGLISGNTTWEVDTVSVTGDIIVNENVTLTIKPGTWISFRGNYGIEIRGYLIAEGIPGDTIVFTRTDTLGFSDFSDNKGGWKGLAFMSAGTHTDTSSLSICKISFVKCIENAYGALYVSDAHKLSIRASLIENNYGEKGAGIHSSGFQGASILIKDCLIRNNFASEQGGAIFGSQKTRIVHNIISNNHSGQLGGGISLTYCDELITGNIFKNNYAESSGGGICIRYGSPRIEQNIFEYNQAAGGGGGISCSNFARMKIINNRFTNNTTQGNAGGGIQISRSSAEIINNIIDNNEGGGLYVYESDVIMVNNTICNNYRYKGGGLYCENSTSVLYNNILWNNAALWGNQIYIRDNFSSPDIFYCTVQDGVGGFGLESGTFYQGNYQHNLESDPLFAYPASGTGIQPDAPDADWGVLPNSPCINTGTPDPAGLNIPEYDIRGNQRISHGKIDMGAIEILINKIYVGGTIPADSVLVADTVEVTGDIVIPDGVTLTIAPGTKILFNGHYKVDVKGRLLAQGTESDTIYFAVKDTSGFSDFESIDGSWDGINFDNGFSGANGSMNDNDSSLLSFCHIAYAKTIGINGGAILLNHFSKFRMDHCVLEYNGAVNSMGGGVYLDHSNPCINLCRISNNFSTFGGAAIWSDNSDYILSNSIIEKNICTRNQGYGSAINMRLSSPRIINCDIAYNFNDLGYAGGLYLENSDPVIMNCRICNNISNFFYHASAIHCQYGKPLLINNLIANNSQYAMKFQNAEDAVLINNTIVNNENKGITFDNSKSHIYNTIFWGNTGGQIAFEESLGTVNDINFNNCIIENGISTSYVSKGYISDYTNVMEISPGFIQPSQGAGKGYDGLTANWMVDNFSPCINSGNVDIPGFSLPLTDLAGLPRINSTTIDLGAYEHQGMPVKVTVNPQGGTKCEGDSISFSIHVDDQVKFQWQRNNLDIPGANTDHLFINPITPADEGVYRCIVSNAYGTSSSGETYLIVKSPPVILNEPSIPWLEPDKMANISVTASGSIPMAYQWTKGNENIQGANSPNLILRNIDYQDEGTYYCIITNSCGEARTVPSDLYLAPQICMVTVSTTTGYNLVIWEKNSKAPITAYNLYRESNAAGIFDLLATIPHNDLSIYTDNTADPTVQAYLYRITAVDTAGFETDADLCRIHKTIHLLVSTNPERNSTQLEWDNYSGFDYKTYEIFRSNTGTDFESVYTLSASLNSWTDPAALEGDQYYRIAVNRPDPCYPSGGGLKAGAGPYQQSMSNLEDNKLKAGQLPPDTITLNSYSIPEGNLPGMLVGKLFTKDKDTLDSHTYQFVPGEGDQDNISFTLLGDLLLASETFDYEIKSQYLVRIRSSDKSGNYCEIPFIIQVIDIDETTGLPVLESGILKASPNPFNQSTIVSFPNPSGEAYRMILRDLSGKVHRMRDDIRTSEIVLGKGDLTEGLYIIELKGPSIYRCKIIIK